MSKRRHGLLGPLRQAPGLSAGLACGVALIAVSACSSGRSGLFDGTPYAGDIEPTIGRPQVAQPPPPVEPAPAPEPSVEAAELPTPDDSAAVVEAPEPPVTPEPLVTPEPPVTPGPPATSEAPDDVGPEPPPAPAIATAPPTVSTPPVTAPPPTATGTPAPAPPVPAAPDPAPPARQAQVATAPPQLILAPPAIAAAPRPTTVAEAPAPTQDEVQAQLDRSAEIAAAQRDRVPPAPALPATPAAPETATPPVAAAEPPATEAPAAPPAGTPAIDRLPRPPTREGFPSLSDVPELPADVPTQAELAEMQERLERDRAALRAGEVPQRLTPRIPDQPASGFSGLGDAPAGPPAAMPDRAPTLGVPSLPADTDGPQTGLPIAPSGQPQAAALPAPPVSAIQAASLPPLALQIPPPPQRVRVAAAPAPARQPDPPAPSARPAPQIAAPQIVAPEVAAVAPPSSPAAPRTVPAGPQALPRPSNEDGQPPVIPGPVEAQPLPDFRVDEPDTIPDTQLPADPTERAFLLAFSQSGRTILPDGQISGTAALPTLAVLPAAARPQAPPGEAIPAVQPLSPAQPLPVTALPPVQPLPVQPALAQAPVTIQPSAFTATPLQQGALAATIFFAEGSARLSNRDREVIAAVVEEHRRTGARIRVLGHASRSGAIADPILRGVTNYGESLNRARAVAAYLSQLGVPATMVSLDAAGEQLAGSDEIRNRRAEIYLDHATGQG